ncbi:hypothetical protein [Flavobacterium terrae]|uniref:Uncharacterized protein n=1 Tax=Flavobacterium terrae TaxID=415425 RepID=A0A1M6H5Q4_9FLAO|nr:hypothetical protein [Flavobacterium terrae]SHJ17577.1 hypothetical protein SAMN05444363_2876 [Flavobacterium terrae]
MINHFRPIPNSFKNTFCVFEEVSFQSIKDFQVSYSSESGSKYYYTEEGMYRLSNHWGRLANSKWRLIDKNLSEEKFKVGFANWEDFYPDNDFDKLYYLEWDKELNDILYQHKNNPDYNGTAILRTSKETQKRLKNARNILQLTNWAKYFETDINVLREKIIGDLINTELSLDEIKRKYL